MEANAADKPVPREIGALLSSECLVLRQTERAVTPFGGLAVFISYLQTQARRFAHAGLLRNDRALHALLGLERFPIDDTIGNLFRKFGMGHVQRLYEPLAESQTERLPFRRESYTLDLDSTVLERYGKQEGSLKGHNPRKHGRPSHHPLLAVLGSPKTLRKGSRSALNFGIQDYYTSGGTGQPLIVWHTNFEDRLLHAFRLRSMFGYRMRWRDRRASVRSFNASENA